MKKIAIIGAGLSGVSAANLLQNHADVTLFEKARGVGGRMSTRRAAPYGFDHGAQYFTARTQAFQDFIAPLLSQGIIAHWDARYVKFDGNEIVMRQNGGDGQARYVGVPGMNQVIKYLAQNLNICLNTRIVGLQKKQSTWQLCDAQGQQYGAFDWVILTAPAPQSVALLPETFQYYAAMQAMDMRKCFSLMLGFKESLPLEFEAAHVMNSDLSWIAVNSHKPGRSGAYALMVHSSAEYAEAHIDDDPTQVMQHLITETSQITGHDVGGADYTNIHGWRYANNAASPKNTQIFLDRDQQLAVCGDWCLGGRVEGAFLSADQLVNAMKAGVL
jgi:predicted NAD/FAD-dependent oxidoreductase